MNETPLTPMTPDEIAKARDFAEKSAAVDYEDPNGDIFEKIAADENYQHLLTPEFCLRLIATIAARDVQIVELQREKEARDILTAQSDRYIENLKHDVKNYQLNLTGQVQRGMRLMELLKESENLYGWGVASVVGGMPENQRRCQDEARELMRKIREELGEKE